MMLRFHKTYLTGQSVISGTQTYQREGKDLTRDLNRMAWIVLASTKLKINNVIKKKKIMPIKLMDSTFFFLSFQVKRIYCVLDSNSYIKKINMPFNPLFLKNRIH